MTDKTAWQVSGLHARWEEAYAAEDVEDPRSGGLRGTHQKNEGLTKNEINSFVFDECNASM